MCTQPASKEGSFSLTLLLSLKVGDLYITFDVKFPAGGLSADAKEGTFDHKNNLCSVLSVFFPRGVFFVLFFFLTSLAPIPSFLGISTSQKFAGSCSSRTRPAFTTAWRRSLSRPNLSEPSSMLVNTCVPTRRLGDGCYTVL
jgi:hypothetical protein